MSLNIADNFSYLGKKPLDNRLNFNTIVEMVGSLESTLYDGLIAYVVDEQQYYTYSSNNEIDFSLGKWRELSIETVEPTIQDILPYEPGTTYKSGTLVYLGSSLYMAMSDFVSDDTMPDVEDSCLLDVTLGNLTTVSTSAKVSPYTQNTSYEAGELVFVGNQIAKVVNDYTSNNTETDAWLAFESDTENGFLLLVNPEKKNNINPYVQGEFYNANTLVFLDNYLARVIQDFFATDDSDITILDSFVQDIDNGYLSLINKEFESPIVEYTPNTYYPENKLLFSGDRIFKAVTDFMSAANEDLETAIYIDIISDNMIEMAENYKFKFYYIVSDIEGAINDYVDIPFDDIVFELDEDDNDMSEGEGVYDEWGTLAIIDSIDRNNRIITVKIIGSRTPEIMSPAPREHKVQVTVGGMGYEVGDELPTSLPNEFYVVVDSVDEQGGIEDVTLMPGTTNVTPHGIGAIVEAIPVLYAGHGDEWFTLDFNNTASSEGVAAGIEEYIPGKVYKKDTLIYLGNIQYRAQFTFTASDTEETPEENLNKDIQLANLIRMTPEEVKVPEFLGTFMSEEDGELPEDATPGNWGLVINCTTSAPGQPGIAVYTTNGWSVSPIPQGEMAFPEPPANDSLNFRRLESGETTGEWVAFESVDGNDIALNIKLSDDGDYIPGPQEPVWYDGKFIIGDGTTSLMDSVPFYEKTVDDDMITSALGYIPEDSANRGTPLGYAPLDEDGLVPAANLPLQVTNTYSKAEIDTKDSDTLVAATTLVTNEATRAANAENDISTALQSHVDNNSLHVTQTEKDEWNDKVDADDLQTYDNHISDTVIHVTQAEKDKWNGMSRAYFVTKVADLPLTDNDIGNIGYVQTSAAGITPIICQQYIWNGTKWEPIDSSGVALTFNWGNLEGKPASTPLSIDNSVTVAHNHVNKTVLDKIGQTPNGDFTFDGIPIGIRAVFLENQFGLPDEGEEDVLYVVYSDSRVRNFPSISVYRDGAFQVLGRGTQDAPPTVGEMSILQAEYFGVAANSSFTISITPDVSFCFLPVEILKEIEGAKNVKEIIVDFLIPENFLYDSQVLEITSTGGVKIDNKPYDTTIDTVGDFYYSSVEIDLSLYNSITGIE